VISRYYMLNELFEIAESANLREKTLQKRAQMLIASKEKHIPKIKQKLQTTAKAGKFIMMYSFPFKDFVESEMTDISEVRANVDAVLDEWFKEEPDWRIPILYENPYPKEHLDYFTGNMELYIPFNVWFDFRVKEGDYVLK
jgi:hypothetical protein